MLASMGLGPAVDKSNSLRVVLPIALPTLHRTIGIITREHYPIPAAASHLISQIERVSRELTR
jgi:hypothetical protein